METELVTLANTAASALIGAMVSDSWTQVKENLARLLARGGAPDRMLRDLETSHAALVTARARGGDLAGVIEAEWRARLQDLLRSDPAVGERLVRLLDPQTAETTGPVINVNSGKVSGPVIQAGRITGGVTTKDST